MSCKLRAVLAIRLHPRDMGLRSKAGTVCISPKSITQSDCSRGCRVFIAVCPSVFFRTASQKPMQLGSPNLTHKCCTMSPGNLFILGSKGHQSLKQCRRGVLHSCGCWLLLLLLNGSDLPSLSSLSTTMMRIQPKSERTATPSLVSTVSSRRSVISAARNQVIFCRRPVQAGTGATRDRSILPGRRRHVCRPTGARVWTVSATNRRPGATHTRGLLT